jgi:hypothetical protein
MLKFSIYYEFSVYIIFVKFIEIHYSCNFGHILIASLKLGGAFVSSAELVCADGKLEVAVGVTVCCGYEPCGEYGTCGGYGPCGGYGQY